MCESWRFRRLSFPAAKNDFFQFQYFPETFTSLDIFHEMNGLYEEFDSIQTHIYQDSLSSQSTQAAWPSGWGRRISQAQVQTLTTKLELFLERLLFNSSVMLVNSQLLASRQLGLSSPLRLVDILFSIYFFSVYEAYPWTSWVQLSALTTIQLHLNIFFREQGSRRFARYALRSND